MTVAKAGQVTACPDFEEAVNTCGDAAPLHLLYNAALVCGKVPRCDLKVDYLSRAVALCRTQACGDSEAGKLDIDLTAAQQSCRCSVSVSAARSGGSLAVGGRDFGKLPTVVEVGAGDHEIKATWAGGPPLVRTVRCSKPGLQQVSFAPPPSSGTHEPSVPADSRINPWTWVALGVGVAGIAAGATLSVKVMDEIDARDRALADIEGVSTARQHHEDAETAQTWAIASYSIGAAGITGAALLLLLGEDDHETTSWKPALGVGFAGVVGRF